MGPTDDTQPDGTQPDDTRPDGTRPEAPRPDPVARRLAATTPPADDLESYVGLEAPAARERARQRGWRTVREVPEGGAMTLDYRPARLNLTLRDGRVTRCWNG
ncbi:hypothetical protein [Allostreptomyces psammosilenae]|uniref:Proteinase inhibitor I78 n=1 Tax=Allostreptomyces psammosilenae TaxID=1892865 RepID=A0A853A4U5_9ACTN|nr:hypothetical protein [Allostreptomyces psammosilenae]NYI05518.1 hypothetical protein [Allostreptomyces psammosilenae]